MTKQKKIKKRSKIVNVNKSDYRKSKNKCVSIISLEPNSNNGKAK